MNEDVKWFIEEYIDQIDQENWEFVFNKWYSNCSTDSPQEDDNLINEFFDVLNKAGIGAVKERSLAARIKIISTKLDDVISDRWASHYSRTDTWYMNYSDIVSDLYSWLGFSMEELYEMLNLINDDGITPKPEMFAFEMEGL